MRKRQTADLPVLFDWHSECASFMMLCVTVLVCGRSLDAKLADLLMRKYYALAYAKHDLDDMRGSVVGFQAYESYAAAKGA